ncbi:hypothetical protein ACHAWO_005964 [Cyclotella atomus]|uniref:Uncharacterized protein n=1 Tax=Cyclotella atomus TaxID=382360 RepID=A0ABD3NK78_9STRA
MKLAIINTASVALALLGSASATDSAVNLRGAVSAAIEYNPNKQTAAEKRQANRDERRSYSNPNRSQAEEDAEAARKARQARNRGAEDPNNGWNNSARNARNRRRCEEYGVNCNYSSDTGDDYYNDDDFEQFGKTTAALKKIGVDADVMVDSGYNSNKNSAAQKRSMNRDSRSSTTNKNRSQAEE